MSDLVTSVSIDKARDEAIHSSMGQSLCGKKKLNNRSNKYIETT